MSDPRHGELEAIAVAVDPVDALEVGLMLQLLVVTGRVHPSCAAQAERVGARLTAAARACGALRLPPPTIEARVPADATDDQLDRAINLALDAEGVR